ncbi:MAG: MerR family transcriptional regulator [Actinomycetes bacterium]
MSAQAARKPASLLSIGQVLAKLGPEFPDLSPSKLRFLEDQGLITPQRTPSGYRKFDAADLERLRYILTLQRDHYLPLKVILGHLDDIDHGRSPQIPGANVRVEAPSILGAERRLSRAELQSEAGATKQLVGDAISAQLLPGTEPFGDAAVQALKALVELERFGIEPRHLRGMRQSAQREAALIESALKPMRGRRETSSQAQAAEAARDLASHIQSVRELLTRDALGA